jgi:hypothetical protein
MVNEERCCPAPALGRRAPILETKWNARKDEAVDIYEPKAELADGPKLPRLEMLKRNARTLRGKAESKDEYGKLLGQISELERQAYIAGDVLAAAGTLVLEDGNISQSELNQARTLLKELIAEATA